MEEMLCIFESRVFNPGDSTDKGEEEGNRKRVRDEKENGSDDCTAAKKKKSNKQKKNIQKGE